MKIKKIILTLVLFITGVTLVACVPNSKDTFNFTSNKEVYGFEAMSAGFLLNNFQTETNSPLSNNNEGKFQDLRGNKEVSEDEINKINEYLGIMEQMLNDKPLVVNTTESDREEYQYKMVITTKDLNQNEIEYVLYYNEIFLKEVSEDDDKDEIESRLEGILVLGDIEYEVIGEKEVEQDEVEISFEARIDAKNWVKIEQEIENDEMEFKYIVCVDGVKSMTKISIEEEKDGVQMKLSFLEDNTKTQYFFKIETEDNKEVIKIKVVSKDLSAVIKVYVTTDPETGEVIYEYRFVETGQKFTHRNNHCYSDHPRFNGKDNKNNQRNQHGQMNW